MGLLGMTIPEAYGGAGLDAVSAAVAIEEIAEGPRPWRHREREQLGVRRSHRAARERGSASPVPPVPGPGRDSRRLLPHGARLRIDAAHLRTRARREGDFYLLTGDKAWVTNVQVGRLFVVLAATRPEDGARGISAFLVESDFPGFTFGKVEEKMGLRSSLTEASSSRTAACPSRTSSGRRDRDSRLP
jgi:alkylation response protein AidB-like acyl-CoA dehydrogenase